MSANAYPLQWPVGRARWSSFRQHNSTFKMSDSAKVSHLLDELDRLDAGGVVISTNRPPYSRATRFEDPGVAVYFTRKGKELCITCDKWDRIEDNIHSIGLAVEAMRGLERWGTGDMVDAAFSGFTALPESIIVGPGSRPWHEVLEVSPNASPEVIKTAYKRLLLKYHPDHGGTDAEFHALQRAYQESQV